MESVSGIWLHGLGRDVEKAIETIRLDLRKQASALK